MFTLAGNPAIRLRDKINMVIKRLPLLKRNYQFTNYVSLTGCDRLVLVSTGDPLSAISATMRSVMF